jgi:hypothetical protein
MPARNKRQDEMDVERDQCPGRPYGGNVPFSTIALKDCGGTSGSTWVWSDGILMDLNKYQALKIELGRVGDTEYLFVVAGGFTTPDNPDWKSQRFVMKRA